MTTHAVKRTHVVYEFTQWERFVRVWQAADSGEAAARALELTVPQAKANAAALRKLGVELRRFRASAKRLSTAEIQKLKAIARSVVAQQTIVQPGGK